MPSSATSGAAYGGNLSMGSFNVGGGKASSGGVGIGDLLVQYWPVLAAVGVIWYVKSRKK